MNIHVNVKWRHEDDEKRSQTLLFEEFDWSEERASLAALFSRAAISSCRDGQARPCFEGIQARIYI